MSDVRFRPEAVIRRYIHSPPDRGIWPAFASPSALYARQHQHDARIQTAPNAFHNGLTVSQAPQPANSSDSGTLIANPSERSWVDYDALGDLALCVLDHAGGEWRDYAISTHAADIARIAQCGSPRACELLGIELDAIVPRPSDTELAQRFFAGDVALFEALRNAYANRPPGL